MLSMFSIFYMYIYTLEGYKRGTVTFSYGILLTFVTYSLSRLHIFFKSMKIYVNFDYIVIKFCLHQCYNIWFVCCFSLLFCSMFVFVFLYLAKSGIWIQWNGSLVRSHSKYFSSLGFQINFTNSTCICFQANQMFKIIIIV